MNNEVEEMRVAKENLMRNEADCSAILQAIKDDNGLSVEIIWSAMLHLKNNPTCTIEDAIDYGFNEWIK